MTPDAWPPPPADGRLSTDAVHVWQVVGSACAHAVTRLERLLSADELATAGKLATAELRTRYVVAHGALRTILARYLDRPPSISRSTVTSTASPS